MTLRSAEMTPQFISVGLLYAPRFKTFPLKPGEKTPAAWLPEARHGYKSAVLADRTVLQRWCRDTSNGPPNLGLAVGEGHLVIDLDEKEIGDRLESGERWLEEYLERRGLALPPTREQRTPHGGRHLLYRLPAGHPPVRSAVGILPCVDLRGHDGYIAVAPSILPAGRYEWVDHTAPIAELPLAVLQALEELRAGGTPGHPGQPAGGNPRRRRRLEDYLDEVQARGFAAGSRDESFMYLARDLHWAGFTEWDALDTVEAVWRATEQPDWDRYSLERAQEKVTRTYADTRLERLEPIGEAELAWLRTYQERLQERRVVAGAEEARQRQAGGEQVNVDEALGDLDITCLGDVAVEAIDWLWRWWLPRGKLVILAGDPEAGKSTIALDLASRLTTGSTWPDGEPAPAPASVLLLTAEDGLADTVKPRVLAAGGDPRRMFVVNYARELVEGAPQPRMLSLPSDIERIRAALRAYGAGLLIIDVLSAYLSAKIDSHKDADVRSALMPLAKLAEEEGTCVLCIMHLNKGTSSNVLYRVMGSMGFVGTARVVLMAATDPDDETKAAHTLLVTKSNIGPKPAPQDYEIQTTEFAGQPGVTAGRIHWRGASELTEQDLIAQPGDTRVKNGLEWLRRQFDERGPELEASALKARFQREVGKTERTLNNLANRLGVERILAGAGTARTSIWVYPPRHAPTGER